MIIAFLFLFNPNITVIDPLPDFIGYILLCVALYRVADLNDSINSAYNSFKRMIFVDACKIVAIMWAFGMSVTTEKNTSLLLWTFIFAVLEMIFLIPAYSRLFGGLTQLGYLYPNSSLLEARGDSSKTDKMRNATVVFVSVRAVMSVLPELADLTNASYDETIGGTVNLYRYIGIMRAMAFVVALAVGIAWLIRIEGYFSKIRRDAPLGEALAEKYRTEIMTKTGIFVRRNFRMFTTLAIIALIFTLDLRLEGINVLPDSLAAVIFAVALIFINKCNTAKNKRWIIAVSAFFCTSVVSYALEMAFFLRYDYGSIIRNDAARILFSSMIAVNIVKSLSFISLVLVMMSILFVTVSEHTGYVVGMERAGDGERKMIDALRADLRRTVIYSVIASVIYVISDTCYDLAISKYGFVGLINVICGALCIVFFSKAFSSIQAAIDTKYMLE